MKKEEWFVHAGIHQLDEGIVRRVSAQRVLWQPKHHMKTQDLSEKSIEQVKAASSWRKAASRGSAGLARTHHS